jgi:hypothetical protein
VGRITFQHNGGTLPLRGAMKPLQNSRRRREVSVIKKRQIGKTVLNQARDLTQELFSEMGPATEKELFKFYRKRLGKWLDNLKSYRSKTDVGHFPGKKIIEQSLLTLERLLGNTDSYDFFKQIVDNKNDYLDLEEDYRDLRDFFTNQLRSWQQLQQALRHFEKNRSALDKDEPARQALSELETIYNATVPYGQLHRVADLVETVEAINEAILAKDRENALERVDEKIQQLQNEIGKSGIETPDLSNRLLRPLQIIKADLESETSISGIYMLQTRTIIERLDDALFELERAVQAEAERQEIEKKRAQTTAPAPDKPKPKPVIKPKPIVEVAVSSVFNKVSSSVYLESDEDIAVFLQALKQELEAVVHKQQRVRIR